jgi:hypothetical protein
MAERKLKGRDPDDVQQSKAKIIIFGRAGVGKTWVSIDFANVYYIDVEGGAKEAAYRQKLRESKAKYFGPEDGSQNFETVTEEIISLATVTHPYKTVVIDSYSKLFNTCSAEQEEKMLAANQKVEFSIEKKASIRASRKLVRWLDRLDMNVILICHERPLWAGGEQIGTTYDGWDKMEYELDLVLQIQKRGTDKRVAIVRKTRLTRFPDGTTFDWSYSDFAQRYGRDALEGDSRPIALATAEQVTTIKELVKHIRVDQDTIDKWFNKAKVESFEEMDTATISKCIEFLTTKMPKQVA